MSHMIYEDFCWNVQQVLEQKHITRTRLAERMGVTVGYITQILNGHRKPGIEVLERVAIALDVTPDILVRKRPKGAGKA